MKNEFAWLTSLSPSTQAVIVYLAPLAGFSFAGMRADTELRVVLLGQLRSAEWVDGCACWLGRVESAGTPDVFARLPGPRSAPQENWMVIFGHPRHGPRLCRADAFTACRAGFHRCSLYVFDFPVAQRQAQKIDRPGDAECVRERNGRQPFDLALARFGARDRRPRAATRHQYPWSRERDCVGEVRARSRPSR